MVKWNFVLVSVDGEFNFQDARRAPFAVWSFRENRAGEKFDKR